MNNEKNPQKPRRTWQVPDVRVTLKLEDVQAGFNNDPTKLESPIYNPAS